MLAVLEHEEETVGLATGNHLSESGWGSVRLVGKGISGSKHVAMIVSMLVLLKQYIVIVILPHHSLHTLNSRTMPGWWHCWRTRSSRMLVTGTPSLWHMVEASCDSLLHYGMERTYLAWSKRTFFKATISPLLRSRALSTVAYGCRMGTDSPMGETGLNKVHGLRHGTN